MQSFSNKKSLRFIVTLGVGQFGASNNNQITLEGYRATVDIDKAGGQQMGALNAMIYGVRQSDMNSITTLQWKPGSLIPNTIQVYAIDGLQETLVFQGNIINAWGNYNAMPDVGLQIQAQAAYFSRLQPVPPRSYRGAVDVATVMGQIAATMGLAFEPNGVAITLSNTYLGNTALEQAFTLAQQANLDLYIDDSVLAITLKGASRQNGSAIIPEISPTSGLVGYPTFDGVGVNFQCKFNPAVMFGGRIKLTTSLIQAAGEWIVTSVAYKLESEKPLGFWHMNLRGNSVGLAISR